jgi:hypothetical protein
MSGGRRRILQIVERFVAIGGYLSVFCRGRLSSGERDEKSCRIVTRS